MTCTTAMALNAPGIGVHFRYEFSLTNGSERL
jgi:hypothetical protein